MPTDDATEKCCKHGYRREKNNKVHNVQRAANEGRDETLRSSRSQGCIVIPVHQVPAYGREYEQPTHAGKQHAAENDSAQDAEQEKENRLEHDSLHEKPLGGKVEEIGNERLNILA